ncbi:FG-GAP-like repeat-containing protein [Pontibacter sp. G13]|uniref:FG-GAP-like repeat-containing protein n=1 Tax=Pontibacter sp. G13 TaxID=3074898 RepID=UPI00288A5A6C|nr:FG-GAP-like repeat-containing protein [Pontibacter sp. G13]WNJ18838.1 FG-GAP-like repeat-containing protein [Pontibacter sp. G13]
MRFLFLLLLTSLVSPTRSWAQNFHLATDIPFSNAEGDISSPFAGGFNQPQFSQTFLNGDDTLDLVVFDRAGQFLIPFLWDGGEYHYAPEYRSQFPRELRNWVRFADANCDGHPDIFTSYPDSNGIALYVFDSSLSGQKYYRADSLLRVDTTQIFVAGTDVPAITDIDGDQVLDILTFDFQGTFVRWFKGVHPNGDCDTLTFILGSDCWGGFSEAGLSNELTLGLSCRGNPNLQSGANRHAGSTLTAYDQEGDGAFELLLGDLNNSDVVYVHNDGTPQAAQMDAWEANFPLSDVPVDIRQFPATFYLDVDHDGANDLIAAPNAANISINVDNVWFYQNEGSNQNHQFSLQQTDFLVGEMIDLGEFSNPVWFDHNADGLLDLIVGNYLTRAEAGMEFSSLALFENIGTATDPAFELITPDWLSLSDTFNPPVFGMHPAFGDLDGDNDPDMLIGDISGKVHFFRNVAPSGQVPQFQLEIPQAFGIDVGQDAAPVILDYNRDGKMDLLIGEKAGNLNYFENLGTILQPSFPLQDADFGQVDVMESCCSGYSVPAIYEDSEGNYQMIVGAENGGLYQYENIEQFAGGAFPLTDSTFGMIEEGARVSLDMADIDQDGRLDMAVGNARGGIAIYLGGNATSIAGPFEQIPHLLKLFPNPGDSRLTLAIEAPHVSRLGSVKVQVLDMMGRKIISTTWEPANDQMALSMENLPSGAYLVKCEGNDWTASEIWIKQQGS